MLLEVLSPLAVTCLSLIDYYVPCLLMISVHKVKDMLSLIRFDANGLLIVFLKNGYALLI